MGQDAYPVPRRPYERSDRGTTDRCLSFERSIAAALLLTSGTLLAGPEDNIRSSLTKAVPDIKIDSIGRSPINGLYEVMVGTQIMYVTGDGRYFLDGRIVDLKTREDLTEPRLSGARKRLVDGVGESEMIDLRARGRDQAHGHGLHRHRVRLLPQAPQPDRGVRQGGDSGALSLLPALPARAARPTLRRSRCGARAMPPPGARP